MKRIRFIWLLMTLLLSQMIAAYPLVSADENWIGGSTSFGTTQGNDFWVTFMTNNQKAAEDPSLGFVIYAVADEEMEIIVEEGYSGNQLGKINIPAGGGWGQLDEISAASAYLIPDDSEVKLTRGLHIYTEKENAVFSCYALNEAGVSSGTTRDAALLLPTDQLQQEYFVQTYPDDAEATEFAVVATEDETTVIITPKVQTAKGAAAGAPITVILNKGEVYMVRSAKKQGAIKNIDMSGSSICADKPVAVFQGNEATKVAPPPTGSYSVNLTFEQTAPQRSWGTDFYFGLSAHASRNYFYVTASEDGTVVKIKRGSTPEVSVTLDKGQSLSQPLFIAYELPDYTFKDVRITASHPVMCCSYLSCGGINIEKEIDPFTYEELARYTWGNSTNAMMPAWTMRTKSMHFFTDTIENETEIGVQHMYVQVTTRTADAGTFTLDGSPVTATNFVAMESEPTMSVANIELTERGKHTISTTGAGFTGFVYTIQSEARAYQYTLGYNLDPNRDTLFIENDEKVMAPYSYDLERVPDKGWYQRQWEEWKKDHERLDTAQVCDSTTVYWAIQTPKAKQISQVEWFMYDVTDGSEPSDANQVAYWNETAPTTTVGDYNLFKKDTMFTLPDESDLEPQDRIPLMEYEIRAILHRPHLICTDMEDDLDTMRTAVRVTRVYHDTIFRIICMGDSIKCFYDSLPHQKFSGLGPANELDNVTETVKTAKPDSTTFYGDKTSGDMTENFKWKATSGENIFSRHYLTKYGCDSTYTLFLFVCDTFRILDTVHLCKNENITYRPQPVKEIERTYRGIEYLGTDGLLVTTDTVDTIMTKTKACPCKFEPYKDKYPIDQFEGCDSIYEVHIFLHDIKRDTLIDTMCYNHNPAAKYEWSIQKGTKTMYIDKTHPNMEYDAGLRTWWGFFSDTLRTTTCPKCNEGKGCDSINVLKLYIPEPFYNKDTLDSICTGWYDYEKHKIIQDESNKYYWAGHRKGNVTGDYLPTTGTYYDSCLTRFGCDSIYTLHLRYDEPFLGIDNASRANNQTYKWPRNNFTYGPFPELEGVLDTTLYFYVSQTAKTKHGCDSVWRLDLRISDTYLFQETRKICDIDSIHWRDTIIVGSKWEGTGSFDIRLKDNKLYTAVDDSFKTVSPPVRDSIYRLNVYQYPTYNDTLPILHVCQNTTNYDWKREDNGDLIKHIVFLPRSSYPFDTIYTDTLHTTACPICNGGKGCDSIVNLPIRINPTYYWLEYDTVCQDESAKHTWHAPIGIHTDTIPLDKTGEFVYWDSLSTAAGHCDSVYELRLKVIPSYHFMYKDTISEEKAYTWTANNKIYGGTKYTGTKDFTVPLGWTKDTIAEMTAKIGAKECDSIHVLHLLVGAVYRDTLDTFTCQTATSYEWKGIDKNGNEFVRKTITDLPAVKAHKFYYDSLKTYLNFDSIFVLRLYRAPSYYKEENGGSICQNGTYEWPGHDTVTIVTTHAGDFDFYDYLETDSFKCDSTFVLHLHVDTAYNELTDTAVCQNTPFIWKRHEGHIITDLQTNTKITDISSAHCGTYEFLDSLKSVTGCDSIWRLKLRVDTVYLTPVEETKRYICDKDTLHFYGEVIYGSKSTISGDTKITVPALKRDTTFERKATVPTIHGCDSAVIHIITVFKSYEETKIDSVCQKTGYTWTDHTTRNLWDAQQSKWIAPDAIPTDVKSGVVYTYIDSIRTQNCPACNQGTGGCDSIWILRLRVDSVYDYLTKKTMSDENTYIWDGKIYVGCKVKKDTISSTLPQVVIPEGSIVNNFANPYETIHKCDSTERLLLKVGQTFRDTIREATCDNVPYKWHHAGDPDPEHYARTDIEILKPGTYYDSLETVEFGFDSIYVLILSNYPSYNKDTTDSVICQHYSPFVWKRHEGHSIWDKQHNQYVSADNVPTDESGTFYYLDTLTASNGCDSIWTLKLYVAPTYNFNEETSLCESDTLRWQNMLLVGDQFDEYGGSISGVPADSSRVFKPGNYTIRIRRGTKGFDCDSVYNLSLHVRPIYRDTARRRICQSNTPYYYEYLNNGLGGTIPAAHLSDSVKRNDTVKTADGCDSIVSLIFYVDSVYHFGPTFEFCQDTVNTTRTVDWLDTGSGITKSFTLDISHAGTFNDSEEYKTIHQCDSTYGVTWTVHPIYRFDSIRHICDNERLVWQHKRFTGSSSPDITSDDSIQLVPGTYYDTAHYTTIHDCDSTFYLVLYVHEIYDVATTIATTCANETYIWHQEDINGTYDEIIYTKHPYDTVPMSVDQAEAEADDPIVGGLKDPKPAYPINKDHMLQTIHGCDSLTHLELTVYPTYFFYTDSTMCSNEVMSYRGKYFYMKDTTYTERLKTVDGLCDSIYQLHLHIKPSWMQTRERHLCEDESLYFEEDGRKVWEPGDPWPGPYDYKDFNYETKEGCDSTYRYIVRIHKKYYFEDNATLCSNDSTIIQGEHYVGAHILYDVNHYYLPFDTVFIDSLKTITCERCHNGVGCDSVYRLNVHVLPQYYDLVEDTICASETYAWRDSVFMHLAPGLYSFRDSFLTEEYGCDSVYELKLYVAPTFFTADTLTKCADEDLTWRGQNLDHIAAGSFLIYDSLLTEGFYCDSVFHLYLTVLDTTMEVNYDTICYYDTLHVLEHLYTEAGYYKDTTFNAAGCHHFIYTHLTVIPPTIPTAWADSMCSMEDAFDIYYTYTSHEPIAFSLYYDSLGHEMGFEDMINVPVTEYSDPMVITVPITLRDGERANYPRPDHYNFRLVLDNGLCQRPEEDCFVDSTFVMSYPVWLTEQRHSDVIALLSEQYNGGYTWDEFQWYHGDSLLVGQTKPYLYIPTGLVIGDDYHVRLTRTGETEDFQTCPVTVVSNPIVNDYAPTMGYLSVVPTCVNIGHPYVTILSRKEGKYRITTTQGLFVDEGDFQADATQVEVPAIEGMFIFQLWSKDTPEEPYRAIKVIVRKQCPNCDISSF